MIFYLKSDWWSRNLMNFIEKTQIFYNTQDRFVFWLNLIAFLLVLIILIILGLNFNRLPSKIPLFYSLPWGESQLVELPQFIILPSMIVIIILINLILSWHLHPSQNVMKRILATISASIALLALITAVKVIFIFI